MALDLGTLNIKLKVNGADSAKKDLSSVENSVDSIEGKSSKLTSGMGKLGTALKGALAAGAVIEGAKAIANGIQACVDAYAEYEQAAGASNLIFGDDVFNQVSQSAQDAAANFQLSSTEYMSFANKVSGALSRGLDGDMQAVASYSEKVIGVAADVASAYGSTTSECMDRITSIANGNYETLDTLTAGAFAGTKAGLEDLITYASEGLGQSLDASNFADVATALEYYTQQAGIAGNASEEASRTISGSMATMQASWQNFLSALGTGDSSQVQAALNSLITSFGNVASNIVPVIGNILSTVWTEILPNLSSLISQLTAFISENGASILSSILSTLAQGAVQIIASLPALFLSILQMLLQLLASLIEGLVSAIISYYSWIYENAWDVIQGLVDGCVNGAASLWEWFGNIGNEIISFFSGAASWLWDAGSNIVQGLVNGITSAGSAIANTLLGFVQGGVDAVLSFLGIASPSKLFKEIGGYTVEGFTIGVDYETDSAVEQMETTAKRITSAFNVNGSDKVNAAQTASNNYYSFGNITIDVSKLKDLTNIEDFVALIKRAQGMNPVKGGAY